MERHTARLAVLSSLAAGLLLPGGSDGAVPVIAAAPRAVTVSAAPRITLVGAGAAERAALDDALARFREHGLDLPDLEVEFSDDTTVCNGHAGGFLERSWRVVACSDLPFVLTHELAHAWVAANVDDVGRNRYVEARRLSTWDSHDVPWGERGIEDAAFIIQQNLMATSPPMSSPTWADRADAYELLTRSPSPLRSGTPR